MVRISVKNFGPIAEGSVDLKPLTIFIGPSNTGKSFLAGAIYAVMKAVEERYRVPFTAQFAQVRAAGADQGEDYASFSEIPHEVSSNLASDVQQVIERARERAINIMLACYGPTSQVVRLGNEPVDFRLDICRPEPLLRLSIRLEHDGDLTPSFDISSLSVLPGSLDILAMDESEESNGIRNLEILQKGVLYSLLHDAIELVFHGFPTHTRYLPAARSGIVQGQKVLAAAFVSQSRRIGIDPVNVPTLPGVTTDFLSDLISLDPRAANLTSDDVLSKAIDFIEREVLHGSIELDESGGLPYPDITYEQVGAGKFTLDQTSSMVSELAPLVLFLKYLVRSGDLLILEEPESHLHPAAQLQMARGIARLVNTGVKVLITTHSGDFIGQIDNLISMSNASEETTKSLGLEQVERLQPEQVSAYGFQIDPILGGAVTYPLPVGSDVGIEDEEFLPVSELLYEQAITLQRNRLT